MSSSRIQLLVLFIVPLVLFSEDGPDNPPECPDEYSVSISSPAADAVFEKGSGETASATSTKDEGDADCEEDVTDDISWSDDASGSGGTSDDFTQDVGEKTLTASSNGESDDMTVKIVEAESINAKDTSTTAGTREAGEGETLVMVKSNKDRKAEIEFKYTASSPDVSSTYPTWTGTGLKNPTTGDEKVNFENGETSSPALITASYSQNGTKEVSIEVINEDKFDIELNDQNKYVKDAVDLANDIFSELYEEDNPFEVKAETKIETRKVDKFNDGTDYGVFIKAGGKLSVGAGSFKFETPSFPAGPLGVTWSAKFESDGLTISGSASGVYDESKADEGSFLFEFTGSTTLTVGVGSQFLGVFEVTASGTVKVRKEGAVEFNSSKIEASGKIGVENPKLKLTAILDALVFRIRRDVATYTVPLGAEQDLGPVTLYEFE